MSTYYEPAFPMEDAGGAVWPGMSLRDFYAAVAMHALLTAWKDSHLNIEEAAYEMAERMLKERRKAEERHRER